MRVKERVYEAMDWGYPPVRNYQIGLTPGWPYTDFPLTYYQSKKTVPDLLDYFHLSVLRDDWGSWVPDIPANGYERIIYSNGKSKFNYCAHNVVKEYNHSFGFKSRNPAHPDYCTVYPNYRIRPAVTAPRQALAQFPANVRDMSSRAFWTMRPKFEGSIDLMSFLLESSDFLYVAKALISILNISDRKVRLWQKRHDSLRLSSYKDVNAYSLAASRAWLTFKLEIEPTLGDVNDILANLKTTVDAAQKKFSMQGEFGDVKHYSETTFLLDKRTPVPNFPFKGWMRFGLLEKDVFTATADFRYKYQIRSDVDAFLRYWKLGGSFETLWEQSRLSFVIDYFLKIGKAVKAMEVDENVTDVTAAKYCESMKCTYAHGAHVDPMGDNIIDLHVNGVRVDRDTMASGSINQAYVRTPGSLYKGLYVPLAAKPKGSQQVTLCALARSMMS